MAKLVYEGPDGTEETSVDAEDVSDSGKVDGVRARLEDDSYLHVPYARLYWIKESEEEGGVAFSRSE